MVLRFMPVSTYDIGQVEAYFSHMAEQGLFFQKIIGFAIFERGVGEKTKYHLHPFGKPFGKTRGKLDEELRLQLQSAGWEYISTMSKAFFVFKATNNETKEFPTNSLEWQKGIEKIRSTLRFAFFYSQIVILISLAMLAYHSFFTNYPVYYWVKYRLLIFAFAFFFFGYEAVLKYIHIKKLNHYLNFGSEYGEKVVSPPTSTFRILNGIQLFLHLFVVFVFIYSHLVSWEKSLTDYQGEKPTISLAAIEKNPNLQIVNFPDSSSFQKVHWQSFISYDWTELAPEVYIIQEEGVIETKDTLQVYSPAIDSEVYTLRFQFLVKPYLREAIEYQKDLLFFEHITCEALENTKFDQAYFCFSKNYQGLFASIGKKVICVDYFGDKDLTEFADEIYQAVAE